MIAYVGIDVWKGKTKDEKEKKHIKIDLLNGILISFSKGRDGGAVEINIDGRKKKLSQNEVDDLIDGLTISKQWFKA